jgi:peroxiredoxin
VETADAVSLTLTDLEGSQFDVAEFRGRRVLLFLFATFDLTSHAAVEPLQQFAREHTDLKVIGIAVQPDARELLAIFASALEIEFDVAYDADNLILRGLSGLGQVNAVPSYVLIESDGTIAKQLSRPMNAAALSEWTAAP